jgi:hypothetical protein
MSIGSFCAAKTVQELSDSMFLAKNLALGGKN